MEIALTGKLVTPRGIIPRGEVLIRDGKIAAVRKRRGPTDKLYISPGFIDLHIHGDPFKIARREPRFGTTAFLWGRYGSTTNTVREDLRLVEQVNKGGGGKILGLNLEGPYINRKMKGALPGRCIRRPNLKELKGMIAAGKGLIKIITVAPEVPRAIGIVEFLRRAGVVASMGHTAADFEEAKRGIDAGISYATHAYNRMSGTTAGPPGAFDAVLIDGRIKPEVILDGVHVPEEVFKLLLLCKGGDKIILVTDSVTSAPLPGSRKCGAVYRLPNGRLAGSALTMNRAVSNAVKFGGLTIQDAVRLATINPAQVIGVDNRKGSLKPGKDADLTIFDEDFNVKLTMVEGRVVYKRKCVE